MGRVRLISLGATMFQRYSDQSGTMEIVETPESLLRSVELPHDIDVEIAQLPFRSGAELSLHVIALVRDRILGGLGQYDGFVVAIGTDTMEEVRAVPPPPSGPGQQPGAPPLAPSRLLP
jgi:L-asparaginase/Glu-tRNA(Gln) amidotransferase subunit D